jgi:hypothetical protein|tara:strand:- start:830 stop:979 length:150 start_codon:yes stop_codon:yes gene_type:complete
VISSIKEKKKRRRTDEEEEKKKEFHQMMKRPSTCEENLEKSTKRPKLTQ